MSVSVCVCLCGNASSVCSDQTDDVGEDEEEEEVGLFVVKNLIFSNFLGFFARFYEVRNNHGGSVVFF